MSDALKQELSEVYKKPDPWNYARANRHAITVGLCQGHWNGGTLLEYACGEGVLLEKLSTGLSPVPSRVWGFDLDSVAAARAMDRLLQKRPLSAMVMVGDLRDELLPLEPFDMVLLSDVLPYIPNEAERVLQAVWKQVSLGGVLVLTSWLNGHEYGNCFTGTNELPGGEVMDSLRWDGWAVDGQGVRHRASADYLVIKRISGKLK